MKYNKTSIRLQRFNYARNTFFVTICAKNRGKIFGKIINGENILNDYGKIVETEWGRTAQIRKNAILDVFIVMPDHFHGIITLNCDANKCIQQSCHKYGPQSNNLFAIIRGFKGTTTKQINILQGDKKRGPIWQSRFYDHIIKTEKELDIIKQYIINNPKQLIS